MGNEGDTMTPPTSGWAFQEGLATGTVVLAYKAPHAEGSLAAEAVPRQAEGEDSPTVFTVSGAEGSSDHDGSSARPLNGDWFQAGSANGKPVYHNGNNAGAEIRWEAEGDWAFQHTGTPGVPKWTALAKGHHRYVNEGDTMTPPTTGWAFREGLATGSVVLAYNAAPAEGSLTAEAMPRQAEREDGPAVFTVSGAEESSDHDGSSARPLN